MLNLGARHIILAGRGKSSSLVHAEIDKLNTEGAHLIPVQLDVGNREQVKEMLGEIKGGEWKLPPLRGVMHAAGTLSDGFVSNQDWNKFSLPLKAKVDGTLNLHELTQGYLLEHFVLFSSFAALAGPPGQSSHAAGNCFEDAMAHYRHSIGLPATTVNWGVWAQVGVATEMQVPGIKGFSTKQGLAALEYAIKSHRVQTCAMNMDSVGMFMKVYQQAGVDLDESIRMAGKSRGTSKESIRDGGFWKVYDSKTNEEEKYVFVKHNLINVLRKILKVDDAEVIEDNVDFQRMGVDSLMLVEMKNALQSLFGERLKVRMSSLRESNNIGLLSAYVFKSIEGQADNCTSSESNQPPSYEDVKKLIRIDSQLSENIKAGHQAAVEVKDIATVLLTGANGTLGPYILRELCAKSQIKKIYCVVRSRWNESAETRLRKELGNKDLLSDVDLSKVECIDGDVARPNLGMSKETWDCLAAEVNAIFNCAARVDYVEYYKKTESQSDIRAVNIGGTKNVLQLASEGRLKHVYHASSIIAVAKSDKGRISEEWPEVDDFDGVTIFSYATSKFVCDLLLKQAVEHGIPCKSFRFPLLTGDSKTGRFSIDKNHFMLRYFHMMKTETMPSLPFPMQFLPVDICADASIKLFFNQNAQSDIYNVLHHYPNQDADFIGIAKKLGYDIGMVEFSEFAKSIQNELDESPIAMFKEFYRNEEVYKTHYFTALRSWLEGNENFWISEKLKVIEPDFYSSLNRTVEYLEQDLKFAKEQGWFNKYMG